MHDIEELRLSHEFSIERAPQICQDYCLEYLTIAQKNLQNISETYLLVLTEYLINFARVLRDGKDSPIDFEELAQSKLNDYDFQLYHDILRTNLSAIVTILSKLLFYFSNQYFLNIFKYINLQIFNYI